MIGLRIAAIGENRVAGPRVLAIFSVAILAKEGGVGGAPGVAGSSASDADHPWLRRTDGRIDDVRYFDRLGEVRVGNGGGEPRLELSLIGRRLVIGRRQAGAGSKKQRKQNRWNSSHGGEDIAQRAPTLRHLPAGISQDRLVPGHPSAHLPGMRGERLRPSCRLTSSSGQAHRQSRARRQAFRGGWRGASGLVRATDQRT